MQLCLSIYLSIYLSIKKSMAKCPLCPKCAQKVHFLPVLSRIKIIVDNNRDFFIAYNNKEAPQVDQQNNLLFFFISQLLTHFGTQIQNLKPVQIFGPRIRLPNPGLGPDQTTKMLGSDYPSKCVQVSISLLQSSHSYPSGIPLQNL